MASVAANSLSSSQFPVFTPPRVPQPLHRIQEVRKEQGLSLRAVSKKCGIEESQLRQQEEPSSDIRISELYQWQAALEVPIAELLYDANSDLSSPIRQRAQMIKIMKTVQSICEASTNPRVERLSTMLREQLLELMPELDTVVAWPAQGSRRPRIDLPKIVENTVPLSDVAINLQD